MRKIDELIGIIKGITFDGFINDREIECLQSWIDQNSELIFDQKHIDFIKLVETVCKNSFSNDYEIELLNARSEEFLKETRDYSGQLYELNGIIMGIVCDDEVNETEIYHLKEHLAHFGISSKNHKLSADLLDVINEIVGSRIVTEGKEDALFITLSARVYQSLFETKLDQLRKKVKNRVNIGLDLIRILDSETAIAEIHRRAEFQLKSALISHSGSYAGIDLEIIVVSLALIAIVGYDSNFYENVRFTYEKLYENRFFTRQKIEGKIRRILDDFKKSDTSSSRARIIDVVLEHAIVPQAYLPAFFEFIFDIYKINFEYDLPDDLYDGFQFVFEGLRNEMLTDNDNVSVNVTKDNEMLTDSDNVTKKTYKLIVSTKKLIAREDDLDALIKLSIVIVRLIDRDYWGEEVTIFNPYLKVGYEKWKQQQTETASAGRKRRARESELRSRWEPKFLMDKNYSVYLVVPFAHKVKAQYNYTDLVIEVLNGDEVIIRKDNFYIKRIIGGYQIELRPPMIKIDKPLGELTYRLVCADDIIYESGSKLHRNYIVFNNYGQEIKNNTEHEGAVFICYKAGEIELNNILNKESYSVGYKLVRKGDTIAIGHDVFSFSSRPKAGVFGQHHKNCFISKVADDKRKEIYKKINVLAFEAGDEPNRYEVVINDIRYKLTDMKYKKSETRYNIDLDLKESGMYTIVVNQIVARGKKNQVFSEQIVYDPSLKYRTESLDDGHYRITVKSGLLRSTFEAEISALDFNLDLISFEYNGEFYSFLIPFDFGFYRINDGNWYNASDDLWIYDIPIGSTMSLLDSECDELTIYSDNGAILDENIAVQDKGAYKIISIGNLESYKHGNKYVRLVFYADGKMKYKMRCYNECVIDAERTEIRSSDNPKRVLVTPVFHGKNDVYFEIYDKDGEKVYTSDSLQSGQAEVLDDYNSFEEYSINFHEKKEHQMLLRKPTLIYQVKKTFYAKQDFVDRVFRIDKIYYHEYINNMKDEIEFLLDKEYVLITDVLEDDLFKGQLFVEEPEGLRSLDRINPVEIELCSDVIDDTIDVYMSNNGDGLLFYGGYILNSIVHDTASDIYIYTLSMKG